MTLRKVIEDLGYETRSYSGRGMYGKKCLGVTIDEDLIKFVFDLGMACQEEEVERPGLIRTDQLGLGTIIYFPGQPYETETNAKE